MIKTIVKTLEWFFYRPRYLWLCIVVTGTALIVSLRPNTTESIVRITGLVLQLLGVLTVIWGISETRAMFGRPTIVSKIKAYFLAAPFLKSNHASADVNVKLQGVSLKASAGTMGVVVGNTTLEGRLDLLEKKLERVSQSVDAASQKFDRELQMFANRLRDERTSRAVDIKSVSTLLENLGTGGIHISTIGAVWLFVGIVLSTAAPEIARFMCGV